MGVTTTSDMVDGLDDVDVVMMLRIQRERMDGQLIPSEQEYFNRYGLTEDKLKFAKQDAIVMHPGPINRGLEIASNVADGSHSVILNQVTNGIAVRMSIMAKLMGGAEDRSEDRSLNRVIRNGHLVDPANGINGINDIYISDGKIVAIASASDELPADKFAPDKFSIDDDIDASGQYVFPGLIDLCARLREPGEEHKATIESETRAAVSAGITRMVCPPDTFPIIDTPAMAHMIQNRADDIGYAKVHPLGALTVNLQGQRLTDMAMLMEAGCVGVSNALETVEKYVGDAARDAICLDLRFADFPHAEGQVVAGQWRCPRGRSEHPTRLAGHSRSSRNRGRGSRPCANRNQRRTGTL